MAVTEKLITERLRTVMDPELDHNIVDLGLIYKIKVGSKKRKIPRPRIPELRSVRGRLPGVSHSPGARRDDTAGLKSVPAVSSTKVHILMTLTTPGCPLAGMFDALVRNALKKLPNFDVDKDLEIELTFDPPWTPDLMNEEIKAELGFD